MTVRPASAVGHRAWVGLTAAVTVIAVLFSYLVSVASADMVLTVRDAPQPADIMVVLGGDGPTRSRRALELWGLDVVPRLIVSGDGDCLAIRDALVAGGVPSGAIQTECLSRNTWENALMTGELLNEANLHTAILVTSWFHSRRALASFQAICPGIRWISVPTATPPRLFEALLGQDGSAIAQEYAKTVLYRFRIAHLALTRPARTGPCFGRKPAPQESGKGTP